MADRVYVNLDEDAIFFEAMKQPQVYAAVRRRAQTIATKALRIDSKENKGRATITIKDRRLGNGRIVCEVHSDDVDGEHGTSKTKRRRTLRRAAGAPGAAR